MKSSDRCGFRIMGFLQRVFCLAHTSNREPCVVRLEYRAVHRRCQSPDTACLDKGVFLELSMLCPLRTKFRGFCCSFRFCVGSQVRLGAQFAVSGILISSLSTASHLQCCDGQFVWHVGLKFSCAVANLGSASWPSSGTNVTCNVEAPPGRLS